MLKRDWYAVLECQTSTVNKYSISLIMDVFHQQSIRSEFSALQLIKNHSLFMCSCILCRWFSTSFLVPLLTLLTNYQARNIALHAKCLFVWFNKNLWWLNNLIYIRSIPVLYTLFLGSHSKPIDFAFNRSRVKVAEYIEVQKCVLLALAWICITRECIFTAGSTLVQSAVLRSHVVCLSVFYVGELWSHLLTLPTAWHHNFIIS